MRYNAVERMLPAEDAFASLRGGAAASRVASLQCMTVSMMHPRETTASEGASGGDADGGAPLGAQWPPGLAEDVEQLGVTPVVEAKPPSFWAASSPRPTAQRSKDSSLADLGEKPTPSQRLAPVRSTYRDIGDATDADALKALLEVSLTGPTVLERVASAQILDSLSHGTHAAATQTLDRGLDSHFEEIRGIAEVSSVVDAPFRTASARQQERTGVVVSDDAVSFALHGTWGRLARHPWYAPGSELHEHIQVNVSANLYDEEDYPRWSGGHTAAERSRGAQGLIDWMRAHTGATHADTIYAHSHGGNVVLEAMSLGLTARMLVLMHVPPHHRPDDEWATIRFRTERTMVYRVRLDRIVFADMIRTLSFGGAMSQRFDSEKLPHIDSEPHPVTGPWFDHGYYTKLENWTSTTVANDINYYLGQPPMQ